MDEFDMYRLRVADEVWIATALLHRMHPDRADFTIREIVAKAEAEKVGGPLRPGLPTHVYLHCVANRPPNPARHRMLVETGKGRRRLYRPGDPCHALRLTGKYLPEIEGIPAAFRDLVGWYRRDYAIEGAHGRHPLLALRGLGKDIWRGVDPDEYVRQLRQGWR